ncbi:MAG: L-rhamnose mutarotase [Bacteroidales bacterium]
MALYRKWHETGHIWKEIPEGLRRIGILDMEIYILENRLFMIVETSVDFDWDKAFSDLSKMPRQDEWEAFVGEFQKAQHGAKSDEKWRLMERMFKLP